MRTAPPLRRAVDISQQQIQETIAISGDRRRRPRRRVEGNAGGYRVGVVGGHSVVVFRMGRQASTWTEAAPPSLGRAIVVPLLPSSILVGVGVAPAAVAFMLVRHDDGQLGEKLNEMCFEDEGLSCLQVFFVDFGVFVVFPFPVGSMNDGKNA